MHCVQASLFCTPRCHISALIFTGGVLSVQSCWGCDTSVVFYVKVHCVSVCFHHIVAFYYLWPPPLVFVSSLHVFFLFFLEWWDDGELALSYKMDGFWLYVQAIFFLSLHSIFHSVFQVILFIVWIQVVDVGTICHVFNISCTTQLCKFCSCLVC